MAAAEGALQGGPAPAQQGGPSEASEYDSELFKRDEFRLWCMKVIPCTKRFVHDWTICPFAHAGEKAVRRDPRLHNYTGIACPDMKKTGNCIRAEKCPYAHNVFEYWLHPTRYRTQLCNDGPMCRRGICFFAHSLEELRVPACKPYVSPEALARASLEAIQQNPHPLGQQLANPVVAAQQQAAMAALSRPRGGGRQAPQGVGGAAYAQLAQGAYRPSGEPARYSAPSAPGLLAGSGSGELGPGVDYMAGPSPPYDAPRWSHPGHAAGSFPGSQGPPPGVYAPQHGGPQYGGGPQQYGGPYPDGGQRRSDSAMRYSDGGQRYSGNQRYSGGQQSGPQRFSGGYGSAGRLSGNRGGGGSTGSFGTAGEQDNGGVRRQGPSPPAPQPLAYPSAPARATSPAGQAPHGANRSFAAVQHPPPQGFGSFVAGGGGEGASARSVGAPCSVPSVRTSSSHSDDEAAAAAGGGGSPRGGSPAVEHGLAESLASLKIAMTQQQLAATTGSNHEVVITTLHQILKDAMAQQGGAPTPTSSFGAAGGEPWPPLPPGPQGPPPAGGGSNGQRWSAGSPDATAGLSFGSSMPTVPSGTQFPSPQTSADAAAAAAVAAVAAAAAAAGLEVGGKAAHAPPPPASPAAAACFQAALTAAAGGYPGVMPVAAPPLRAGSAPAPVDDGSGSAP